MQVTKATATSDFASSELRLTEFIVCSSLSKPTLHFTAMSDLVYLKDLPGYTKPKQPAAPCKPQAKPLCEGLATAEAPYEVEPLLPCTKCKGDGYLFSEGFQYTREDGTLRVYESKWKPCMYCDGAGWFHAPDLASLVKAVNGRKPRTLRSKRPDDTRAYFVWRMARFHGGKDVCLPMAAGMDIAGDPYENVLDQLATIIAKAYFGSGNVGAARWQQAMYGHHNFKDVPAVIDGPVYDSDKPVEEMLETV